MKRLFATVVAIAMSFAAHAIDLKEGVHYEVVSQQETAKPEIKEFFSYYCPHCYTFETVADSLKAKSKANGYTFKKSHVDFLRAAGPEIQFMLTKALVLADKLDAPKASKAIFDYIHKQRAVFTKEKDVRNIFLLHGVSGEEFDKAFNSFAVKSAAKRMKSEQDQLARRQVLTSVPTFIINGKYKLNTNSFDAKTYDELFSKVEEAAIALTKK